MLTTGGQCDSISGINSWQPHTVFPAIYSGLSTGHSLYSSQPVFKYSSAWPMVLLFSWQSIASTAWPSLLPQFQLLLLSWVFACQPHMALPHCWQFALVISSAWNVSYPCLQCPCLWLGLNENTFLQESSHLGSEMEGWNHQLVDSQTCSVSLREL